MTQNPYSPPANSTLPSAPRIRLFCTCMFWLCIILALIAGMIAIGGGYQNYAAHSSVGGTPPPYIVAVVLLIFLCSVCLAYSASRFRKHELTLGMLSFIAAAVGYFGGPRILLAFLASSTG